MGLLADENIETEWIQALRDDGHDVVRVVDVEELVASFTSGCSPLDATRPDTGSTNSTYRLRINVEPATLEPTES